MQLYLLCGWSGSGVCWFPAELSLRLREDWLPARWKDDWLALLAKRFPPELLPLLDTRPEARTDAPLCSDDTDDDCLVREEELGVLRWRRAGGDGCWLDSPALVRL